MFILIDLTDSTNGCFVNLNGDANAVEKRFRDVTEPALSSCWTLDSPAPGVRFIEFGENGLEFELRAPSKLLSNELKARDEIKTMKGEELKIESRAGLWVNEAKVISPDLQASNGVLHGIDAVLMPQSQAATAS